MVGQANILGMPPWPRPFVRQALTLKLAPSSVLFWGNRLWDVVRIVNIFASEFLAFDCV